MENSNGSMVAMSSNDAMGWVFLAILLIVVVAGAWFWLKTRNKPKPYRPKQAEAQPKIANPAPEIPEIKAKFDEIPARLALLQQNNLESVRALHYISVEAETFASLVASVGRKVAGLLAQQRALSKIVDEVTQFSLKEEDDMADFARWIRVSAHAAEINNGWPQLVSVPPTSDYAEAWKRIAWTAQNQHGLIVTAIKGYDNLGMMLSAGYASTQAELNQLEQRLSLAEAQVPILKIKQSLLKVEQTMGILVPKHGLTSQLLNGGTVLEIPQQTYKMLEEVHV